MEIGTRVFSDGAYGTTVSEPVEQTKSRVSRDYFSKTEKLVEYTETCVDVKWDDGDTNSQDVEYLKVVPPELLTEEFKAVQASVNAKLQQAADLIGEAGKLAKTVGKNCMSCVDPSDDDEWPPSSDTIFDHGVIESAMGQAGWNTSGWYC